MVQTISMTIAAQTVHNSAVQTVSQFEGETILALSSANGFCNPTAQVASTVTAQTFLVCITAAQKVSQPGSASSFAIWRRIRFPRLVVQVIYNPVANGSHNLATQKARNSAVQRARSLAAKTACGLAVQTVPTTQRHKCFHNLAAHVFSQLGDAKAIT